ncbi:MAG TPA: Txe/YoeB family addiction module toxin [Chitinophagales bacterium]|nr:Txe/YoeB family addiction module toxin [Chitinophagales bacterium]
MRAVLLTQVALDDLNSFKTGNQKLVFKVLELISDIQKTPFEGIGKPEPLKHQYSGCWSRRINDEHRLVYKITNEVIEVLRCRDHY